MSAPGVVASKEDLAIVERLRAGDELAFMMLVEQHTAAMLRIARMYVSSRAVAEDVVAEAWLGVVKGIERFEGRSSLRTWIYRIVANIAKTRGAAEGRSVPFSSLAGDDETDRGVEPSWFYDANGRNPGGWTTFPEDWRGIPEARLLGNETLRRIGRAIEHLPPLQAEVIRLRAPRVRSTRQRSPFSPSLMVTNASLPAGDSLSPMYCAVSPTPPSGAPSGPNQASRKRVPPVPYRRVPSFETDTLARFVPKKAATSSVLAIVRGAPTS